MPTLLAASWSLLMIALVSPYPGDGVALTRAASARADSPSGLSGQAVPPPEAEEESPSPAPPDEGITPSLPDPVERPQPKTSGPRSALEEGLAALEELDLFTANKHLEVALTAGPYAWAETVALYSALGIVRAYLDDEEGALTAFDHLLAVDPSHSLAYTTSPKATFLFERIRKRYKTRRATEVRMAVPAVVPFGVPIDVELQTSADPLQLVDKVVLLHRLKGEETYRAVEVLSPPRGQTFEVTLPAPGEDAAFTDEEGQVGLIIEVALVAYDANGWEVFRRPAPERPLEVPVGFDAPGPWYTQWWVWAAGGAAVAVTAAAVATVSSAGVAAWWLQPDPDSVNATTTFSSASGEP